MPKIKYTDINISSDRLGVIKQANAIIRAYTAQGYDLTLRQLYYQFVSRDLIPNKQSEYKRLGDIINDGRLAGLIDWDAIVDRTRNLESLSHWGKPSDIVESAAQSFRIDKWATQPYRVEVWIEKDALAGVFERVCQSLDVPYFSCRGYTLQSEMWAASQRLLHYRRGTTPGSPVRRPGQSQMPVILHFGDHDPSGIDMTRDIEDRLSLFMGGEMEVRRMALNFDQVEQYQPPPNPAKLTDSRCAGYIQKYGSESWELDALEPTVLADLVRQEILALRDEDSWDAAVEVEDDGRTTLQKISDNYEDVKARLDDDA